MRKHSFTLTGMSYTLGCQLARRFTSLPAVKSAVCAIGSDGLLFILDIESGYEMEAEAYPERVGSNYGLSIALWKDDTKGGEMVYPFRDVSFSWSNTEHRQSCTVSVSPIYVHGEFRVTHCGVVASVVL